MTKIYKVQMNSKGMPNFSTAVEVADRPQGEWVDKGADLDGTWYYQCSNCHANVIEEQYPNCPYCLARMKGADDEDA